MVGLDIELKPLETAALVSSNAALHTTQHGGYNNPEVDALLDKAIITTDLVEP